MEKLVVAQLNYFLENKRLLREYQTGFRKAKSTTDALVKLSNETEKTLIMKEVMVAVFLDVEKAYDTMWREGILIKLDKMGIGGKMYNYILDFLSQRAFSVKVGEESAEEFTVENGIPQGSVISPVLFNLMINDIFEKLGNGNGGILYADDAVIWKRGRNISYIVMNIQKEIQTLEQWGIDWGFKFSVQKSNVMFFTKRKIDENYKLCLYSQSLERVKKFKYLGVWFDEKHTWKYHINHVEKIKKSLELDEDDYWTQLRSR